jgi:hypothetical protein
MKSTFTYAFSHYLFPTHSNNQKAKLLHGSSLALITCFLLVYHLVIQSHYIYNLGILGYAANIPAAKVVELTNQKRIEAGLQPLTSNDLLSQAAKAKGEHMLEYDYWAHVAPDGTEPWKFFTDYGYVYRYAGENLARDFNSPESAVEAWMASPTHRENLLSPKYNEIGIAVIEGDLGGDDATLIVQLFGTQTSQAPTSLPVANADVVNNTIVIPTTTPSPTATLTPTPTITQESEIVATVRGSGGDTTGPISTPFNAAKTVSTSIVTLLLGVLVIDGVITTKKKVARVGGRTFAHMAFFGMILAIVLIAQAGQIL